MTLKLNWTLGALLTAGIFAIPQAWAQQTLGTFTLPVAAHFGTVTLQPGDYTLTAQPGTSLVRISGENGFATIMASSVDNSAHVSGSRITLANVNGEFALERFDCGSLAKRFDFSVAKEIGKSAERERSARSGSSNGSVDVALR